MLAETDRLILRHWRAADREPFAKLNEDPQVMRFLGAPLSRQDSDAAIDRQIALSKRVEPAFWAVERKSDAEFMGCIGVKKVDFDVPFAPCYEIGWRLGRQYWGFGYATEGAKAALHLAFTGWKMEAIYSFTVPANTPSQLVMQKIGMERVIDGDFQHPKLAKDDPLSAHVLYKLEQKVALA